MQQDLRIDEEGARQVDPLPHADRELVRMAASEAAEARSGR